MARPYLAPGPEHEAAVVDPGLGVIAARLTPTFLPVWDAVARMSPRRVPCTSSCRTPSWSFIDSNLFPDFNSNGTAGEGFAQPPLRTHIDAVISMDYYTVTKMLKLTGPLSVPGFGITVDANNFIPK